MLQAKIHFRGMAALTGTALLMFAGIANAKLTRAEQKCVNTATKSAQKVALAQSKDISSCVKDFAKGRDASANACVVSDPKGKVANAKNKYDRKMAKDCGSGSGFISLADPNTAKQRAIDKELSIIRWVFGPDLDTAVIPEASNRANSKCQQAVTKAIFKCQDTKWKEYNSCKKNKLTGKGTVQANDPSDLQDECLGTGTGSIPDPKAKIAKKCQTTIVDTITKKCPNLGVFPGCNDPNAPATAQELRNCIEYMSECELCLTLNHIDGLDRDCDLFDDGLTNDSCGAVCGDGAVNQPTEECDDGNGDDGDGCTSDCIMEFCGDGIVDDAPNEECDDGNGDDGDGCTSDCLIEFCGDGTVNDAPNEECDDGNGDDGDGCTSDCLIEFCGDGIVNDAPNEECDDGNMASGDGCTSACGIEFCGDGTIQPGIGEECEPTDDSACPGLCSDCACADVSGSFANYTAESRSVYIWKTSACAELVNLTTFCEDRRLSWWTPKSQADAQELIDFAFSLDSISHTWIQVFGVTTTLGTVGTVGGFAVTVDAASCASASSSGWAAFRKWPCSFCEPEISNTGETAGRSCCWDTDHLYDWVVCELP